MTLAATTRRAVHAGNSSATSFAFTFRTDASSEIVVTANIDDVESTLVLNSDYSVTLNGDQSASPGGSITYPLSGDPLATGDSLVITSAAPWTQPLDLPAAGNFSSLALETQLDRIVMQVQQLREQIGRAALLPITSTASASLPAPSGAHLIGWNSSGTALQNYATQSSSFTQDSGDTATRTMLSKMRDFISPLDFGAVGDGVTDDTTALQNALDFVRDRIIAIRAGNSYNNLGVLIGIDGGGRHYLVSSELVIGENFRGMVMQNFVLIAKSTFTSNTGTISIDHDTGYITPTGTLKAVLRIGDGTASSRHSGNVFSNILIECDHRCDGLYATGCYRNTYANIEVRHAKRYGMRFDVKNTDSKLFNCLTQQWGFGEAADNARTAVGIAIECGDMMSDGIISAHNAVNLYYQEWGGHSVGRVHVYTHAPDGGDDDVFAPYSDVTDSGVANTSASGNKLRITTSVNHGLSTGDLVYIGWIPGINNTTNAASQWSEVTVQSATVFDADNTIFGGTYYPQTATVTFTGGGSANIVYAGIDVTTVDAKITFQSSGTLPAEITAGTKYYVKTVNTGTNTITIAATKGGTAITFAGSGSGTHTVYWRSWQPRVKLQTKQPIGIWIAPNVSAFWADSVQLDGVTIRSYSSRVKFSGVFGNASSSRQRTGYPWFDYRCINASDNLNGLQLHDVSIMSGLSRIALYEQGSGSIVQPLRCSMSNVLMKSGNRTETQGYAEITFGANVTLTSASGLSGTKTGTITLDGNAVALSVSGASVPTLDDVIAYVEATASAAGYAVTGTLSTTDDRIRFTSGTYGDGSTVALSGNIFTGLTNYVSLATPVAGEDSDDVWSRGVEINQVVAYAGTVSDPGIVFSHLSDDYSDVAAQLARNTGLYAPSTQSLAYSIGGVQVWLLDSAGQTISGKMVSSSATAGIGYTTGAGGTVTQATSRTTGVTLNKVSGDITLVSAAGSASWQSFTLTNSTIAATDSVTVVQKSGTDLYQVHVTAIGAGSCQITYATTGGTTTEQPVFHFDVHKGVNA